MSFAQVVQEHTSERESVPSEVPMDRQAAWYTRFRLYIHNLTDMLIVFLAYSRASEDA